MLTKVILEGEMGKKFGREWAFDITSPAEALRMVDANSPGVFIWIKSNLAKYEAYRVVCKYENGTEEELDKDSYVLQGKPTEIRFVPLIEGAGGKWGRVILGAVLVVVGFAITFFTQGFGGAIGSYFIQAGVAMMIGGIIQALTPQPKKEQEMQSKDLTSHFFDGPVNTTEQGVPVQLIYGEVLVGSHAISAEVTVDQLM